MKCLLMTIAVSLCVLPCYGVAPGQDYCIDRYTVDGGGVMFSTGGDFELSGTIGQPDAGLLTGGNFKLDGGFWYGLESDTNLVSAMPACDASLTRSADNCMLLTFDGAITPPTTGEITIRALLAGGNYGPTDLSSQFTFTVEPGNVLKIAENGDVLSNETWYGIVNTGGWGNIGAFKVDYRVVYGDVDNSGSTTAADASDVWGSRGPAVGDCDPYDVDASGTITASDASDVWGFRGSAAPPKPHGHTCSP